MLGIDNRMITDLAPEDVRQLAALVTTCIGNLTSADRG